MLHSLKAKLTLAFGALMVLLFVGLGLFLVNEKSQELSADIASHTQVFAQFTAEEVMESYSQFLEPGNFVPFTRDVTSVLRRSNEVDALWISSYSGVILYDSGEEQTEQYEGTIRTITNQDTLDRAQSNKHSLLLEDGRVLYVKVDDDSNVSYVDFNENPVEELASSDRIVNVAVPYENAYAVFYEVSYEMMDERLATARMQIGLVAVLAIILALMVSFMLSVSITNPLKDLKKGALKIADGDFSTRVKVKTKDEVGVLAKTFNKMAKDLAASTEAMLYQERVQKELEIAGQIQKELLPEEKVELESLDVAGGLVPATEIGGDAFDYIQMKDGRQMIYLGDVTGHGVPAGIVSSITNAVLYNLREETSLMNVVHKLNDVIGEKTSLKVFVTMALMIWDDKKSIVNYINAGHPPVLYYDSSKKKVVDIELPGIALGMLDDLEGKLREQKILLKPNDVLVMYSDGIPEAANKKGMQYGMSKLKRIVQDAANDLYTADGIKNAILSDVLEHIGDQEHADDMTVVVLKHKA
jgi:serine phosphatase RsbU (regulator of sigma subunit)